MAEFIRLEDVDSVLPILKEISIWGGVSDEQRKKIFTRLESKVFKKGEYIFRRGDQPSYIYIVKRGKVDLLVSDDEITLEKKTLSVGECFGVASLMAMQKHTNSAVALEESEVMVLSRQALIELQREDIELFTLLMMNIARELARRLKLTDEILLSYAHKR